MEDNKIKVRLIHNTPIEPLIIACNQPYQSLGKGELVKRVWNSGHRSIARHGMASFEITGVSQSLLRQISRHPHINLTVKSSRYCNMYDEILNGVFPPFVKEKEREALRLFYDKTAETYNYLINTDDYTKEEANEIAKLIIPLGSTVDIVLSGNYQSLFEMLQLRLCMRSEWEIRRLAVEIKSLCRGVMPIIFDELDCRGKELGYCPEHECCGKYPNRD